mmetsp:Transcript_32389/g.45161  ORF Transcript_32389/g.45161 Transcript_32389/m.45161 type:complete len:105 (-) Transcript_32389:17-331(-)
MLEPQEVFIMMHYEMLLLRRRELSNSKRGRKKTWDMQSRDAFCGAIFVVHIECQHILALLNFRLKSENFWNFSKPFGSHYTTQLVTGMNVHTCRHTCRPRNIKQ